MNTYIPEGYKSLLGVYDTQKAIGLLKRLFEDQLAANLNLFRVSAPLFLEESSGLNDNLNGYERPVSFDILQTGKEAQVVQSLAKWKRMALYRYDFYPGKGLYTDMNAIRRDEELDNLHSVYVDQWDWEKVITPETRTLFTLHQAVTGIVSCICDTQLTVRGKYPQLCDTPLLNRHVAFITAQELDERHALLTAPFAPQCANTVGTVHGGMLYTMADGVVSMLARADGHAYVTLDSSFQYLCNTTEPGTLEARAELIRRGHKVSVIRVEITHRESGRLLATGTFTCCRITPSAEGTR